MTLGVDGGMLKHYECGRYDDAIELCNSKFSDETRPFALSKILFHCYYRQAVEHERLSRCEDAIQCLDKARDLLDFSPESREWLVDAYNRIGLDLYSKSQRERARLVFERVQALGTGNKRISDSLFACYMTLGRENSGNNLDEAIKCFTLAHQLQPASEEARNALMIENFCKGEKLIIAGDIAGAAAAIEISFSIAPSNQRVIDYLVLCRWLAGMAQAKAQDYGGATAHFLKMLKTGPDFSCAQLIRGMVGIGDRLYADKSYGPSATYYGYAASITFLEKSTPLFTVLNIYQQFALSSYASDQYQEFIDFCTRKLLVTSHDPDMSFALFAVCSLVGRSIQDTGYSEQGVPFFELAAKLQPNDIGALFQLGFLLKLCNKLVEANAIFMKILSMQPAEGGAQVHGAHTTLLIDGRAKAIEVCRDVINKVGSAPIAKQSLATIMQLDTQRDFAYFPKHVNSMFGPLWRVNIVSKAAPKVLFYGPCQVYGIMKTLIHMIGDDRKIDARYISPFREHFPRIEIERFTKLADAVVYQKQLSASISDDRKDDSGLLVQEIRSSSLPITYAACDIRSLWPIMINGTTVDASNHVKTLLKSPRHIAEILSDYDRGQIDFSYEKRHRNAMSIIKFTDEHADIKMHDFIVDNIKKSRIFLTNTLLSKNMLIEMARQLCIILHENDVISFRPPASMDMFNDWPDDAIHMGDTLPIDMTSYEHFQFQWLDRERVAASREYYHNILIVAKAILSMPKH